MKHILIHSFNHKINHNQQDQKNNKVKEVDNKMFMISRKNNKKRVKSKTLLNHLK